MLSILCSDTKYKCAPLVESSVVFNMNLHTLPLTVYESSTYKKYFHPTTAPEKYFYTISDIIITIYTKYAISRVHDSLVTELK